MNKHKKFSLYLFIASAAAFYFLADIAINPFILWTALPLYVGYALINTAAATASVKKLFSGYGFIAVSISFSVFYHFTWYLDWQGTRSGDSTSALIFVWMPIYAVILGFAGYVVGALVGMAYERMACSR